MASFSPQLEPGTPGVCERAFAWAKSREMAPKNDPRWMAAQPYSERDVGVIVVNGEVYWTMAKVMAFTGLPYARANNHANYNRWRKVRHPSSSKGCRRAYLASDVMKRFPVPVTSGGSGA